MYLSDIPIHDATRDLILLSEQHNAESRLSQRLEILTDKLQQTSRELQQEQQLTDRLLYSILPTSVANDLRLKRPVMAKKYEIVTIMFSGIVDFTNYCNQSSEPMEIVELLNETYIRFDALADKNNEVFKVQYKNKNFLGTQVYIAFVVELSLLKNRANSGQRLPCPKRRRQPVSRQGRSCFQAPEVVIVLCPFARHVAYFQ